MLQQFFIFIVLGSLSFATVNTLCSDEAVIAPKADDVSRLLHDYYNEFDQLSISIAGKKCNCASNQSQKKDLLSSYYSELLE